MKGNTKLITIIAVILIAGVMAYMGGVLKPFTFGMTSGFTFGQASSLTPVISNDAQLQQATISITGYGTGSGQSLVGSFDGNIASKFPGLNVYPLQVSLGNVKETLDYPIYNTGEQIHKFNVQRQSILYYCPSGYQYSFVADNLIDLICVKDTPVAVSGTLPATPNIAWTTEATMSVNGIPYTKTLSNAQMSATFNDYSGNYIGDMQWVGSSVTGDAAPNGANFVATAQLNTNNWNVADASRLNTVKASYPGIISDLDLLSHSLSYISDADLIGKINQHNLNVDNLVNQRTTISYEGNAISPFITSKNGVSSVTIQATKRLTVPTLIINVKASKVAILRPVGTPKIISVSAPKFETGANNGAVSVVIQNIGSGTGTFGGKIEESSGTFYQSGSSPQIQLGMGQTGTMSIPITAGTNNVDTSKTATVTIYDVNNANNKDTQSFTAALGKSNICQPGAQTNTNNVISTCNSDGKSFTVIDCASAGLVSGVTDGKYACVTSSGDATTQPNPVGDNNGNGNNDKGNNWGWIALFGIVTGLILVIRKYWLKKSIDEKAVKSALTWSAGIVGSIYLYTSYQILSDTLGWVMWVIILISVLVGWIASTIVEKSTAGVVKVPMSIMAAISVILFIILSQIAMGLNDAACSNAWISWMMHTCNVKPWYQFWE